VLFSLVAVPTLFIAGSLIMQIIRIRSFRLWTRVEKSTPKIARPSFGYNTLPISIIFFYFWVYTIIVVESTIRQTAVIYGQVQWTFRQVGDLCAITRAIC
jgi:hypothetical protein